MNKLKVLIGTDIEGVTGVVSFLPMVINIFMRRLFAATSSHKS